MLGSVVAKVIRGEELLTNEPNKRGTKEFEEEFGLTKNDEYFIKLFGFTKENVKDSQGLIIKSIANWKMFKAAASKADDEFVHGIGKSIIQVVTSASQTYWFAAATKNQINQNIYGVKWDSKMTAKNCSICQLHFKSFSLRTTTTKHHCRCCGQIVCFNCSPEKVVILKVMGVSIFEVCDSGEIVLGEKSTTPKSNKSIDFSTLCSVYIRFISTIVPGIVV